MSFSFRYEKLNYCEFTDTEMIDDVFFDLLFKQ